MYAVIHVMVRTQLCVFRHIHTTEQSLQSSRNGANSSADLWTSNSLLFSAVFQGRVVVG